MERRGRLRRWEWGAVTAILLLAFLLRTIALTDVPPGLRYDELLNYRMAERVLAGERPIYFAESWGHEPLFHYAQAATIALAGRSDWSLRLPAAFSGLLGVLVTWLLARRLFGPRVAVLGATALAVSFWPVFYSRQGLRAIAAVPPSGLTVYFLWRGLALIAERRRRAMVAFALAGVCLGGALYTYMAARAMPLLLMGLAIYLAAFHRRRLERAAWGLLLLGVVAAVVAAPLVVRLRQSPEIEQRVEQLTAPWQAMKEGQPGPVVRLALRSLGMFIWRGQEDWLYNVYGRPIFAPPTALCFLLGVALCAWRWRRFRCAALLLWLGIGLGPTIVARPAASLSHAIVAQPPAYILLAVGIDALWRLARQRRAWAAPLLAAGLLAFHGAFSGYAYFAVWASAPRVQELYQAGIAAVAHELDSREPPGPVAIGAPYVGYWHPWNAVGFDLALRREDLRVRWFNPAGGWVWPAGEGPSTFYLPDDPLGSQSLAPALNDLFAPDAFLAPSTRGAFTAFRVEHPRTLERRLKAVADLSLSWPPELSHRSPPSLPLTFGERFALLGAELQETPVSAGGEAQLMTYWRVLAADTTPVVAFAHLTSDGRDIWGQHDGLDVRPASLRPGDRFVQVHRISVEPDASPGLYHVQVGLYHPESLARLPISAGEGRQADRIWVGEVRVVD